jgi:hypothetical protein
MIPMRKALLAAVLCMALSACSAAPDPGPVFDNEANTDVACMKHQPQPPGTRYTDDTTKRTDEVLPLLRYYTANGRKPFCDGAGPGDTDRAWARLYVELGADRANVAALTG